AFGLCLFALRPWTRRHGALIMVTLALIMTGIILPGKFLDDSIKKSIHTAKSLIPKPVTPVTVPQIETVKTAPAQPALSRPLKPKEELFITLSGTGIEQTHLIGHFTLFSLLAFLSALSWISATPTLRRLVTVVAGLFFFAASTEVLQFIPADRSAGLGDLRVDIAGMAGAVVLVFVLRRFQRLINRD
ncbi:MAG: VanZ family protein, partial [Kiritimatiellales bacterium]